MREKHQSVSVPHEVVPITVYPFYGCAPMRGWIDQDALVTIAGPPARVCRVEIGPQTEADTDGTLMQLATQIVRKRHYRDAWVLCSDGSKVPVHEI